MVFEVEFEVVTDFAEDQLCTVGWTMLVRSNREIDLYVQNDCVSHVSLFRRGMQRIGENEMRIMDWTVLVLRCLLNRS